MKLFIIYMQNINKTFLLKRIITYHYYVLFFLFYSLDIENKFFTFI